MFRFSHESLVHKTKSCLLCVCGRECVHIHKLAWLLRIDTRWPFPSWPMEEFSWQDPFLFMVSVCVCVCPWAPPFLPHTDLFVFWAEQMRLQAHCPAPLYPVPSGGHLWVCAGQIGQAHHGSTLKTTSLVRREAMCLDFSVGPSVLECWEVSPSISLSETVSFCDHSSDDKRNLPTPPQKLWKSTVKW